MMEGVLPELYDKYSSKIVKDPGIWLFKYCLLGNLYESLRLMKMCGSKNDPSEVLIRAKRGLCRSDVFNIGVYDENLRFLFDEWRSVPCNIFSGKILRIYVNDLTEPHMEEILSFCSGIDDLSVHVLITDIELMGRWSVECLPMDVPLSYDDLAVSKMGITKDQLNCYMILKDLFGYDFDDFKICLNVYLEFLKSFYVKTNVTRSLNEIKSPYKERIIRRIHRILMSHYECRGLDYIFEEVEFLEKCNECRLEGYEFFKVLIKRLFHLNQEHTFIILTVFLWNKISRIS